VNAQQRGGERISARCATKHQIKKSSESKMTNFVFCFCFLSSSLEKIQKEKGREETWERGHGFISSTRSLLLREETHKRVTRTKNARDVSSTERSIQTHFSCVRNVSIVVVVLLLLLHETKERYKREPIFEKNQPLNRQPS
jgi:hypothetical protein